MKDQNIIVLLLLLQGISTLCFFLGVFIVKGFKDSVDKVQSSINDLNTNIATLLEKDLNKDERINEHKELISRLFQEVDKLREKVHELTNNAISEITLIKALLEQKRDDK